LTLGVDIGQRVDPTAIALADAEVRQDGEVHYAIRFLERLPLGTSYLMVTKRIAEIHGNLCAQMGTAGVDGARLRLFLDATGVGQPVADTLAAAGVPVTAVYFTHGDRRTVENGEVRLGKGWLVSRLKTLAQTGRLHLPKTSESVAMQTELLDYEIRVDDNANDRYGAFKTGAHDDLVTAVGLAVQEDPPPGWAPLSPEVSAWFRAAGIAT